MTSQFEVRSTNEVEVPAHDELVKLTSMLGPGINRLVGNEDLEIAYLRYQASVLDKEYAGASNYFRIDQLPDHEREQTDALVTRVASMTSCSPRILYERLQRIRVLTVEAHTSRQGQVGGEFMKGLAVVASQVNSRPRSEQEQNHALLHEITHGLTATREIAAFAQKVDHFGGGLTSARVRPRDIEMVYSLTDANEALVDTTVLGISDIDPAAYMRGEHFRLGYPQEDAVLAGLASNQPDLSQAMLHAVFVSGIDDRQQAQMFAEAFAAQASMVQG